MGILTDFLISKSSKKNKAASSPEEWLMQNLENIPKYRLVTHVGKYSNPAVRWDHSCYAADKTAVPGYISSANVADSFDIVFDGGAAVSSMARLLCYRLENNLTVYENFVHDTQLIRDELTSLDIDYKTVREMVLSLEELSNPDETDIRLSQVYWPTAPGQYHLLSVLFPTALMNTLKSKIIELHSCWSNSSEKAEKQELLPRLHNLTAYHVGGSQPQNISALSNKGGTVLLSCLPPSPPMKGIKFPLTDFFTESLSIRRYFYDFQHLHILFKKRRNNMQIRNDLRFILNRICKRICETAESYKRFPENWTDNTDLSVSQKCFIDSGKVLHRKANKAWITDIGHRFALWLIDSYSSLLKEQAVIFSDTEKVYFSKFMETYLRMRERK